MSLKTRINQLERVQGTEALPVLADIGGMTLGQKARLLSSVVRHRTGRVFDTSNDDGIKAMLAFCNEAWP